MKTPLPYDHENLTPEQYEALLSFAIPIGLALKAGVPMEAIIKHVTGCLEKTKAKRPEIK